MITKILSIFNLVLIYLSTNYVDKIKSDNIGEKKLKFSHHLFILNPKKVVILQRVQWASNPSGTWELIL
jgi:hypothetical protein